MFVVYEFYFFMVTIENILTVRGSFWNNLRFQNVTYYATIGVRGVGRLPDHNVILDLNPSCPKNKQTKFNMYDLY